jgi:glycosyltransferase involved in cell wall biosynthesis
VVFLNWFESIGKSRSLISYIFHWIDKIIKIEYLKLNNIKIVTTFHNKKTHDTKGITGKLDVVLLKIILNKADKIIILSKESKKFLKYYIKENDINDKVFYIPHPNYIGVYSADFSKVSYNDNIKMKILFAGMIKKYKNIELIIDLARKTQELDIEYNVVGKCVDTDYGSEILEKAKGLSNIKFDFEFIEGEILEKMIRESDIMLLPYNTDSSMNSGTAILSFSNGRSVICPEIATIDEFDKSLVYSYTYMNEYEHIQNLYKTLINAYNDWKYNRIDFEEKGRLLFEDVSKNNSREILLRRYSEILKSLE